MKPEHRDRRLGELGSLESRQVNYLFIVGINYVLRSVDLECLAGSGRVLYGSSSPELRGLERQVGARQLRFAGVPDGPRALGI